MNTDRDTRIHPIFAPDNFPQRVDYGAVFQEAVLLASRILTSQQSYHWLFALWFGKNKKSKVPWELRNKSSPELPEEYTTNRGIGELTHDEIAAVDQQLTALSRRVHDKVQSLTPDSLGQTSPGAAENDREGRPSAIGIDREFYNLIMRGSEEHHQPPRGGRASPLRHGRHSPA